MSSITLTDLLDNHVGLALADLHTSLPCSVVKYYPEKQAVDVQPLLKKEYANNYIVDMPVISGVPLVFQGGSNSLISFPINTGDIVLVVFSERSIDKWVHSTGKPTETRKRHLHDLSDGIAIAGLQTFKTHNNPNPDNLEIRFNIKSGSPSSVKLKADGSIELNTAIRVDVNAPRMNVSGDVVVGGDVTASGVSLVHHTHGGVSTGAGSTGEPN